MSSEDHVEKMLKIVQARSHPLKLKLLQLLSIYGELSASELVSKTGKSKPTLLKHLKEMEDLGEVIHRTEISPGAFDRRLYSHAESAWTIRGQDLRERVQREPELAIGYNNFRMSQLLLIKDIVDSMVEYQERLNIEVEKVAKEGNGEEVLELMKDNLGQNKLNYKKKTSILKDLFSNTSDEKSKEEISKMIQNIENEYGEKGGKEPNTHLKLELLLPIRRVIEQLASDKWKKDGSLWF